VCIVVPCTDLLRNGGGVKQFVLKRYSTAGKVSGILCLFGLFNNANSEIMLSDLMIEN